MTMSAVESPGRQSAAPESAEAPPEGPVVIDGFRYVRAPRPLHFPVAETVPETRRHFRQRTLLFEILEVALAQSAILGSDQFVYWDPTDPTACLAPDAFVRLGGPDEMFDSWKVWERGAPEIAVEIISKSDARDRPWEKKLEKYRRLGVRELVRFDAEGDVVSLRIWNGQDGELVERDGVEQVAASRCLPGAWVVRESSLGFPVLRLSRDPEGEDLYLTPAERAEQAERRVRELEAELARRTAKDQ